MASLRTALAVAVLMAFVCLAAAQKPPKPSEPPKNAPLKPAVPPKSPPLGPPTQALQQGEAVEEKAGFVAMYYGILVLFVILWTIYLFLYFFEYGSAGDSTFWLTSYGGLVVLIALGLSKYFTASILAALLAMGIIFIPITAFGFAAMESVSSPDRFEGDKINLGRTRLDNH
jgi:hypothetical protein